MRLALSPGASDCMPTPSSVWLLYCHSGGPLPAGGWSGDADAALQPCGIPPRAALSGDHAEGRASANLRCNCPVRSVPSGPVD